MKAISQIDGLDSFALLKEIFQRANEEVGMLGSSYKPIAKDFDDLCAKALKNSEHCFYRKKKFPKLSDEQKKLYMLFASLYDAGHTCFALFEDDEEIIRREFGYGYSELCKNVKKLAETTVRVLLGEKDAERNFCDDSSIMMSVLVESRVMIDGRAVKVLALIIEEPLLVQMMHNKIPRGLYIPAIILGMPLVPKESKIEELIEKCTEKNTVEEGEDEWPTSTEPE